MCTWCLLGDGGFACGSGLSFVVLGNVLRIGSSIVELSSSLLSATSPTLEALPSSFEADGESFGLKSRLNLVPLYFSVIDFPN